MNNSLLLKLIGDGNKIEIACLTRHSLCGSVVWKGLSIGFTGWINNQTNTENSRCQSRSLQKSEYDGFVRGTQSYFSNPLKYLVDF
jgi:hypothetical protein